MRKPRDLEIKDGDFTDHAFCVNDGVTKYVVVDVCVDFFKPKDVRRLAKWLLKAADWLES